LRATAFLGWLAAVLLSHVPACAQGVIGLDGLISNRAENAFGVGATLSYRVLRWSVGGVNMTLRALGAADLEVVQGARTSPTICRLPDASGGRYYYRDPCDPTGAYVPPSLAEASSPLRFYGAGYGVLDAWRVRLGVGTGGHPGSNDFVLSGLVGFAASTTSWLMVEFPGVFNGWKVRDWRLRLEVQLAGPAYIW